MEFKKSKYYDKNLLGEAFYENINDNDEIFTVHEFFGLNDKKNNYHVKQKYLNFSLKIYEDYYELDCQKYNAYLYLVFDKPVHITGKYCSDIIAPEIIVKNSENKILSYCISDKVIIDNNCKSLYFIGYSKIRNIYFYNNRVELSALETDNFFIFNKDLKFCNDSYFLDNLKIKFFGRCDDLRRKMLNDANFKQRIIHIE